MNNVLAKKLVNCFNKYATSIFLAEGDTLLSYETCSHRIEEYVCWLKAQGIKRKDILQLIFDYNSAEYVYWILASVISDIVCCPIKQSPLNVKNEPLDIGWILSNKPLEKRANSLMGEYNNVFLYKEERNFELECDWKQNAQFILPTSGTTGNEKWVVLSAENLLSVTTKIQGYLNPESDDVFLLLKHLGHISSLTNDLFLSIFSGGRLIINDVFMPQRANLLIKKHHVTILTAVPPIFQTILRYGCAESFASLKKLSLVGGPAKPKILQNIQDALPWVRIYCGYGLTEASSRVTYLPCHLVREKSGAIGIPLDGVKVNLVNNGQNVIRANEIGEIVVEGNTVMNGYLDLETYQIVHSNGRVFTHDLAYFDDSGIYYHVGRNDDIIVYNGNNTPAIFIEQCIEKMAEVLSAYVFVMDNERTLTECLCAVVVKVIDSQLTAEDVYSYATNHIPLSFVPQKIVVTQDIPGSITTGKISRTELRKYILETLR